MEKKNRLKSEFNIISFYDGHHHHHFSLSYMCNTQNTPHIKDHYVKERKNIKKKSKCMYLSKSERIHRDQYNNKKVKEDKNDKLKNQSSCL